MSSFPWVAVGIIAITMILVSPADRVLNDIWYGIVDSFKKMGHVGRRVWKWQQAFRAYGKQGRRHAPRHVNEIPWPRGADDSWADTLRDIPKVRVH